MNFDRVEKIAEAVLYEGYMLYPYRPSSVKNQQRWNFGVLCPRSWAERESESWMMRTECLVRGGASARLTVKVRWLQIVQRAIGRLRRPGQEGAEPEFDYVERLEVGGRVFQLWQEAVEREQRWEAMALSSLPCCAPETFEFPAGRETEYLRDEQGRATGVAVRSWEALNGDVEFEACRIEGSEISKIAVRVRNLTPFVAVANGSREAALPYSLVSAHMILGVEGGEFVSQLDPPAELGEYVATCRNVGVWPVLAGDGAETMLASPIILYDHPQVAEESAGNLFDATEIDEILSLRILTLTEEEKREMRQSDERTREILERTETMPEEQFRKLHGVLRGLTRVQEEAR